MTSDPFLFSDQPQPYDRYAYRFTWKDKKTGLYETKIVYAPSLRHAEKVFQKRYGVELATSGAIVDRIDPHDA